MVISKIEEDLPFAGSLCGRYENFGGKKRYWLNNKMTDESSYFEQYKSLRKNMKGGISYKSPEVRYLNASEIREIIEGDVPVTISLHKEPELASIDTIVDGITYYKDSEIRHLSQIDTYAFGNGYKGGGVGIYFTETGCAKSNYINMGKYALGNACSHNERVHPTGVIRVLQTTAPQAFIYGFDQENRPVNPMNYDPPLYIGSHSWAFANDSVYSFEDKEFDNYIYTEGVIEFVASGNNNGGGDNNYVSTPGKSVNSITVGAVEPNSRKYATYSRWKNPTLRNQKPEVPNFSHFYFPADVPFSQNEDGVIKVYNGTFNGTSAATPYTAAMAADVLSQHPFFKEHPELFKALMMSGATLSVANANMRDMDNNVLVKKIPQYFRMGWNTRSAYWNGNNGDFFDSNSEIVFSE